MVIKIQLFRHQSISVKTTWHFYPTSDTTPFSILQQLAISFLGRYSLIKRIFNLQQNFSIFLKSNYYAISCVQNRTAHIIKVFIFFLPRLKGLVSITRDIFAKPENNLLSIKSSAWKTITFYRFNLNILNDFSFLLGYMQCILHVFRVIRILIRQKMPMMQRKREK